MRRLSDAAGPARTDVVPIIQLWRLDPYPSPEPSNGAGHVYEIVVGFMRSLADLEPLYWLFGLVVGLVVLDAIGFEPRLKRVLAQRARGS